MAAIEAQGPIRLRRRSRADEGVGASLCRAVAGQQLSEKAAATIWARVVEAFGANPVLRPRGLTVEKLRACGLSGAKTKAILAIAAAQRAGDLDEAELLGMSAEERARHLGAIHGVGPWTTDMINIFHFREPDIWPEGDLAVRREFEARRGRRKLDVSACSPYRTYLALHMWQLTN